MMGSHYSTRNAHFVGDLKKNNYCITVEVQKKTSLKRFPHSSFPGLSLLDREQNRESTEGY